MIEVVLQSTGTSAQALKVLRLHQEYLDYKRAQKPKTEHSLFSFSSSQFSNAAETDTAVEFSCDATGTTIEEYFLKALCTIGINSQAEVSCIQKVFNRDLSVNPHLQALGIYEQIKARITDRTTFVQLLHVSYLLDNQESFKVICADVRRLCFEPAIILNEAYELIQAPQKQALPKPPAKIERKDSVRSCTSDESIALLFDLSETEARKRIEAWLFSYLPF
jgi:hypothetical protein